MSKIFETVSFHIVKPCNMSCKFCYATFDDMKLRGQISIADVSNILKKLADAGVKKITFAGGEPLLYRELSVAIGTAKSYGMTTSIISNGYLIDEEFLQHHVNILDWIGISIDSLNPETNKKIGRISQHEINYIDLVHRIKRYGYKLKINTVVNAYNHHESMHNFIHLTNPSRWKIFDTLRVKGQNDAQFEEIKTPPGAFEEFIDRHQHPSMVVENNEAMTGSYLLIDPQGRLFENSSGKHTYSYPLQHSKMDKCLSQINLNREMFIKRGGIYNW